MANGTIPGEIKSPSGKVTLGKAPSPSHAVTSGTGVTGFGGGKSTLGIGMGKAPAGKNAGFNSGLIGGKIK